MKDKIKKFLNVISIILIFIIILELTFVFQKIILRRDYGNIFGYSIFSIESGSMMPTLNIGDDILVKITKDVKENDIVVFKDEESNVLVAHREIKDNNKTIITKGDNNNKEDDPVDKNLIVGKVVKILPGLGNIQKLLKKPYIIIPFIDIILIFSLIINLKEKE